MTTRTTADLLRHMLRQPGRRITFRRLDDDEECLVIYGGYDGDRSRAYATAQDPAQALVAALNEAANQKKRKPRAS